MTTSAASGKNYAEPNDVHASPARQNLNEGRWGIPIAEMSGAESKKRWVLDQLIGAQFDSMSLGRDTITLRFLKQTDANVMEFQVSTYGRIGRSGDLHETDESATIAALPALYTQIGRSLVSGTDLGGGRYKLLFENGDDFLVSDPNRYGDYAMQVAVRDALSDQLRDLVLYD
jgi:hypothetical protein